MGGIGVEEGVNFWREFLCVHCILLQVLVYCRKHLLVAMK